MMPNVVLTSFIAGYIYVFSVCSLLVSFALSHFKKSSLILLHCSLSVSVVVNV